MSKFTRELRYIYEQELLYPPPQGVLSLIDILNKFPLENENFLNPLTNNTRREDLKNRIIEHFYFKEIGFDNRNRFLFVLRRRLNEIMVLYNQRYKSIDLEFNPLWNVDMNETFEHSITGTGKTTAIGTNKNTGTNTKTNVGNDTVTTTNNNESLIVDSDTPNQQLSEADIKANLYASKTSYNKDNSTNTNTNVIDETETFGIDTTENLNNEVNSTDNKTETFTRREFGSSKGYTFAQNIDQWRNIMINIEMEIIGELENLFMTIW